MPSIAPEAQGGAEALMVDQSRPKGGCAASLIWMQQSLGVTACCFP